MATMRPTAVRVRCDSFFMKETPLTPDLTGRILSGDLGPRPREAGDAPEATEPETEELIAWDEPVESAGHRVPTVELEDENSAAIELVEEGLDAADDDLRVEE